MEKSIEISEGIVEILNMVDDRKIRFPFLNLL